MCITTVITTLGYQGYKDALHFHCIKIFLLKQLFKDSTHSPHYQGNWMAADLKGYSATQGIPLSYCPLNAPSS